MKIRRWSNTAGWLLVSGGLAWLAKIAVIVAKDGRELDTGAAAWLMRLGLVCLFVGVTGVGLWLARRYGTAARAVAVFLSPVALAASLLGLGTAAVSVLGTRGPAYLREEIGIVVGAVAWLAVGAWLLSATRRAAEA